MSAFRSAFNRSRWLIWLMGLPKEDLPTPKRRLILIQIDALSKRQLEKALAAGRLPFLASLLEKHDYQLYRHYSGMPCCTPAVQGELFYGVPCGVPSFNFFDRVSGRPFVLSRPSDAREIEERLERQSKSSPLLRGGSAYSNIFTGGADEPHFCISSVGFAPIFTRWKTVGFLCAILLHLEALLRAGVLLTIEAVIALRDCFGGILSGRHIGKEFLLVFSRVGMCILLRELLVIGARIDIARSLPVIQLNFMGYHDQSHRRGGTSMFAHWTLKGIDWAIKRIWISARKARTDYDIWVYSDHGQIDTTPYSVECRHTFHAMVRQTLTGENGDWPPFGPRSTMLTFLERIGASHTQQTGAEDEDRQVDHPPPIVTSHSPMGHIYMPGSPSFEERCDAAHAILANSSVPVVIVPKEDGGAVAFSSDRTWQLPDETEDLLQADSGESSDLADDVERLCHHPNAGHVIACGTRRDGLKAFTFVIENGSHGGLAPEERAGFCLAPKDTFADIDHRPLRPLDLHHTANRLVHLKDTPATSAKVRSRRGNGLRLMTYNVRNCRGTDGHISPIRIARVIEQLAPDIVALQELDVGRERSHGHDQARVIGSTLRMDHVFFPSMTFEQGHYGNAILSHYPMRIVKSALLPAVSTLRPFERRSALWVEVELDEHRLQVITVHLGLSRRERRKQVDTLLGNEWVDHPDCRDGLILLGDFNFTPRSRLYRRCTDRFIDAAASASKTLRTFRSNLPIVRLDHIFVSSPIEVSDCCTGDSALCRRASDHRPVFADVIYP